MKLSVRILSVLPIAALLAACGQTPVPVSNANMVKENLTEAPKDFVVFPDDKPSIPDGAQVYKQQNCASCHGADGGQDATVKLNDPRFMARKKPVDMYKFLAWGNKETNHPGVLKDRSNREVWNLVVYTRSLGTKPLTDKEMEAVAPVFGANCAICHGTKGDGDGPLARNLEPWPANFQTFRRFYDRDDDTLFDHIANGIKWEGMPNFLGKEDKRNKVKFDHAYIHKLVQYVRAFHISTQPTIVANAGASAPATPSTGTGTSTSAEPAKEHATTTATSNGSSPETPSAGERQSTPDTGAGADQSNGVKSPTGSEQSQEPKDHSAGQ